MKQNEKLLSQIITILHQINHLKKKPQTTVQLSFPSMWLPLTACRVHTLVHGHGRCCSSSSSSREWERLASVLMEAVEQQHKRNLPLDCKIDDSICYNNNAVNTEMLIEIYVCWARQRTKRWLWHGSGEVDLWLFRRSIWWLSSSICWKAHSGCN